MEAKEIFEIIKDSATSFGEARRLSSQWSTLSEEKQRNQISTFVTVHKAMETARLLQSGEYKKVARLMHQDLGIPLAEAVRDIKRWRVTRKHRDPIFVGGAGGKGYQYHWPHCGCGWKGEEIHGEGSYEEAQKVICPNLLRELKLYGLEYKRD